MTYAGIPEEYSNFENSQILLQNIPYDGTSTWGKGADKGWEAFLYASENMELYDIETNSEVYRKGVHILEPILEKSSPEKMFDAVYASTKKIIEMNKFPTFFGGEHSVSIGILKAFKEKYKDLSVLQLDAHTDLRPEYLGTKYNHACALYQASKETNLVQVGVRSMDISEMKHLDRKKCFFAEDMYGNPDWMQKSIDLLGENVFITLDLDVFDPSVMPATGTPEPGGLNWNLMIKYLRKVFEQKNIVGFDIVEHAPIEGNKAPDFLVAKLYYKMLGYKFFVKR